MEALLKIFDSLRLKVALLFKGQKQTIKGGSGHIVAAQSKGGPANAGLTISVHLPPADSISDVERKIARMVEEQVKTAGTRPGGIIIDEREFSILLRDMKPGASHGLLTHHHDKQWSYESAITYDGIVVNRIAGLGRDKPE